MKILIRGAGFQNKGAEAMLRVVQRALGKRIPVATFYATVSPLDAPYANRSGIAPVIVSRSIKTKILRSLPFVSNVHDISTSFKNPDFARAIKTSSKAAFEINALGQVDGVVDVSGFAYGDNWPLSNLKNAWAWVDYCRLKKKPYIFLPQAWGPFEKEKIKFWAKKICQAAALVCSRDNESSHYLADLQNVTPDQVRIAPDIAFLFRGASDFVGISICRDLGLQKDGRPVIGIVPNMRVYERTSGTGAASTYVSLLIGLANYCIQTFKATILLIPNEISVPNATGPDDRFLCGIIESHIRKPEYCFTIREYYSSETVKAIIGQVDMLIASRFHSLVFALSQGVPVLALGWSHKYRELLRSFGIANFVVDHNRFDTDTLVSLVELAWGTRERSKQLILETVPQLQKKVDVLFDEIANMIDEANS